MHCLNQFTYDLFSTLVAHSIEINLPVNQQQYNEKLISESLFDLTIAVIAACILLLISSSDILKVLSMTIFCSYDRHSNTLLLTVHKSNASESLVWV